MSITDSYTSEEAGIAGPVLLLHSLPSLALLILGNAPEPYWSLCFGLLTYRGIRALRNCLARIVGVVGLVLVVATLLPLIPSNEWWIRFLDFPRAQITVLLILVLAVALADSMRRTRGGQALIAGLILCLGYQISRILPYTALWPEEVPSVGSCAPGEQLRYMEVNVLQSNRDEQALLELVRQERPDVLLLTETDHWWASRVRTLARDMPHIVSVPRNNTYGMMLFSRRPLEDVQVRYLFEPDVPSIRAELRLDSGRMVTLYGVHPRPPKPGQDTAERDAELVLVGRGVRQRRVPTIVAGDLNDVAWSDTTALFQEVSGLLDPRVGRQLMPTFPADLPMLRWPLDYVFVSPGFALLRMERYGHIGSDHLPILVELCASGVGQSVLPPARLGAETEEEVSATIQEGREEAAGR